MDHTFIVWRLDGDFMVTMIPEKDCPPSGSTHYAWIKVVIPHEFFDWEDADIAELIEFATDINSPEYIGCEVATIFKGNVTFLT